MILFLRWRSSVYNNVFGCVVRGSGFGWVEFVVGFSVLVPFFHCFPVHDKFIFPISLIVFCSCLKSDSYLEMVSLFSLSCSLNICYRPVLICFSFTSAFSRSLIFSIRRLYLDRVFLFSLIDSSNCCWYIMESLEFFHSLFSFSSLLFSFVIAARFYFSSSFSVSSALPTSDASESDVSR